MPKRKAAAAASDRDADDNDVRDVVIPDLVETRRAMLELVALRGPGKTC
jgi:hypothetical protein